MANRTDLSRTFQQEGDNTKTNMSEPERIASVIAGSALALLGVSRGKLPGVALAILGGEAIRQGVTGHSYLYDAVGVNTAVTGLSDQVSVPHHAGVRVDKSITINRSPEELYRFWRNFENLPRFMDHLKEVRVIDNMHSHWVAKGPLDTSIEWDAEIINEKPNELIGWRSGEGATVPNAGSVQFKAAPGNRGTEVSVSLKYDPPAGKIGAAVAKLFGEEPDQQISDDLRRFKQIIEAGEIPTIQGQSMGHKL